MSWCRNPRCFNALPSIHNVSRTNTAQKRGADNTISLMYSVTMSSRTATDSGAGFGSSPKAYIRSFTTVTRVFMDLRGKRTVQSFWNRFCLRALRRRCGWSVILGFGGCWVMMMAVRGGNVEAICTRDSCNDNKCQRISILHWIPLPHYHRVLQALRPSEQMK